MQMNVKKFINNAIRYFGYKIIRVDNFNDLTLARNKYIAIKKWSNPKIHPKVKELMIGNLLEDHSRSQLQQDILVKTFFQLSNETEKFFVEFGATNGITLSNTHLLEIREKWNGILVEPGRNWHSELRKNRNCLFDTRCVWKKSNERIEFEENSIGELSGITATNAGTTTFADRSKTKKYFVETVSLNDLLKEYDAPYRVTYLSIDTEGSEYEIIRNLDFNRYRPFIISIEHNFSNLMNKIDEFLKAKNYIQVYSEISEWDAWYVDGRCTELSKYIL
jgi:FkbM family methyltransferase